MASRAKKTEATKIDRIKDMPLGAPVLCPQHGAEVPLSESMRKDSRRICDKCISAYKKLYAQKQRAARNPVSKLNRQSLPGEVWLPIPGFAGYEASDHGRIRSLDRLDSIGRVAYGRILIPAKNKRGYLSVHAKNSDEGRLKTVSIHALIALAFHGPRLPGKCIAHNDGNPSNNLPSNLRYATNAENEADKLFHGTRFYARGDLSGRAKLSPAQVIDIRSRISRNEPLASIARLHGVSQSMISRIKLGLNWSHLASDKRDRWKDQQDEQDNQPRH